MLLLNSKDTGLSRKKICFGLMLKTFLRTQAYNTLAFIASLMIIQEFKKNIT